MASELKYYVEYLRRSNRLVIENHIFMDRLTGDVGIATSGSTSYKLTVSGMTYSEEYYMRTPQVGTSTDVLIYEGGKIKMKTAASGTAGTSGKNGTAGTSGTSGTSGKAGSSGSSANFLTDPTFYFDPATDRMYVSNATFGTSITYTGTGYNVANNILRTDGSGVATWVTPSSIGGTSGTSGKTGTSGTSGTGSPGTAGTSGVGSPGTAGTSGIGGEKTFTWVIAAPTVGGIPGPQIKTAATTTRISAFTTANTSVIFNIEKRSAPNTAGTNIFLNDCTAGTASTSLTSFNSAALTADYWLWVDISSVSSTPGILTITLAANI